MPPLYLTEQGAKLEIDNRRATVVKDGEVLATVPLIHFRSLITSKAPHSVPHGLPRPGARHSAAQG